MSMPAHKWRRRDKAHGGNGDDNGNATTPAVVVLLMRRMAVARVAERAVKAAR